MKPGRRSHSSDTKGFLEKIDSVINSLQNTPLRPRKLLASSTKELPKTMNVKFSTEECPRRPTLILRQQGEPDETMKIKAKYSILKGECTDMIDKIGRCSQMIDTLERKCRMLRKPLQRGDKIDVMADLRNTILLAKKREKARRQSLASKSLSTTEVLSRSLSQKLFKPEIHERLSHQANRNFDRSAMTMIPNSRKASKHDNRSSDKDALASIIIRPRVSTSQSWKPQSETEKFEGWGVGATKQSQKIVM